jgi:hypothetical protein
VLQAAEIVAVAEGVAEAIIVVMADQILQLEIKTE